MPAVTFLRELGYRVHKGMLETLNLGESRFDLVSLNHVIEHLLDPLAEIRRVRELLSRAGGCS